MLTKKLNPEVVKIMSTQVYTKKSKDDILIQNFIKENEQEEYLEKYLYKVCPKLLKTKWIAYSVPIAFKTALSVEKTLRDVLYWFEFEVELDWVLWEISEINDFLLLTQVVKTYEWIKFIKLKLKTLNATERKNLIEAVNTRVGFVTCSYDKNKFMWTIAYLPVELEII